MKYTHQRVTTCLLIGLVLCLTLLCLLKETLAEERIRVCHAKCKCNEKTRKVNCHWSRQKLTFIPRMPNYTEYLKFEGNSLYHLYKDTFKNLTDRPLRTLILQNCNIHLVEPDSFEDLNELNHLEINHNKVSLRQLSNSFRSLNMSLIRTLGLKYNNWEDLGNKLFENLKESSLEELFLDGNKLKTFNGIILSGLTKLIKLSLTSNKYLFTISFKGVPSTIQKLDLRNNYFRVIPKFCNKTIAYLPDLTYLILDRNNIEVITSSSFNCLKKLRKLSLDRNRLSVLNDNYFQHLVSLEYLTISRQNSYIRKIKPYVFNISSLLKLRFSENNFDFKRRTSVTIFEGCPNLRFLDMSKTVLNLGNPQLRSMLKPLRNLQTLILVATKMRSFPSDVFPHMMSLRKVLLGGNNIDGWDDDPKMFGNITSLTLLDLSGNDIKLINKTSFPVQVLSSLSHLQLAGNPFTCSCELRWFRDWIRLNKKKLDNWPKAYSCFNPPALTDTRLRDFNPTVASCKEPNPLALIVTISVVCGTGIIIAVIVYKSRWHIRYWVYLLRVKKRKKNIDSIDLGFQFDAFVIYSEEDRQWVHETLMPELEQNQEYKLCIHHRDFDVGRLIVDNIVDNINQSQKIIIVLSNALAKSEWCLFEIRISQDRILNGSDVILVLLKEINHKNLSGMLKALITTTTYAVWTGDSTGQRQFWDQMRAGLSFK